MSSIRVGDYVTVSEEVIGPYGMAIPTTQIWEVVSFVGDHSCVIETTCNGCIVRAVLGADYIVPIRTSTSSRKKSFARQITMVGNWKAIEKTLGWKPPK